MPGRRKFVGNNELDDFGRRLEHLELSIGIDLDLTPY